MMKFLTFFANSLGYLSSASKTYWSASREWFLKTPERALNRAYNAAVMIKMIEEDFSGDDRVCTDFFCIESDQKIALRSGFEKKMLSILKLRLAEFKFSCSVLGTLKASSTGKFKFISSNVGKLRFIDEVLEKYISTDKSTISFSFKANDVKPIRSDKKPQQVTIPKQVTIDVQVQETLTE